MVQKCEYLDQCGFFLNFANNMEVIKESWIKLYCLDREISGLCERKKIRLKTGNPPVNNMAPTGKLM
jgi:hypothetical protein